MWQGWARPWIYWSLACRIWRRRVGSRLGCQTPYVADQVLYVDMYAYTDLYIYL